MSQASVSREFSAGFQCGRLLDSHIPQYSQNLVDELYFGDLLVTLTHSICVPPMVMWITVLVPLISNLHCSPNLASSYAYALVY
ncbi:hypothetical protein BpHYR1_035499 [Brachionus plicatilis]|uniref:Uncharacterized protein n=1 Tax=Brachionus plicatilis TaxID=10195 RepID=A0A3M7R515_BRAPC|nr:hypothetical protein BpHYR1_035499 [Brachionus plicatilis]